MARGSIFAVLLAVIAFGMSQADAQNTSRRTFVELMDVQTLWGEERYDEALVKLQALADKTVENNYDHAVTLQYLAHTAYLAGKVEMARPALEKAVEIPGVPVQLVADIKLLYGQVVLGDEEFELAARMLEDWYATTETEKHGSQVFSLAYASYRTDKLPRSEVLLEEALATNPNPNPSWLRVYYQVLFEQKKYEKAEDILYELLNRDPGNDNYWNMLANHYQHIENPKGALSAMAIADIQGLLDGGADQKRLASMYGYIEAPEKAARVLEAAVANEGVAEDAETLRRLGDLWLLARDRNRAKDYLARAAAKEPNGKTYELLASLFFEDEQWEAAHSHFLQALDNGGLEEPEMIHLLAGISAYRAGRLDAAKASLEQAKESDDHRAQANIILRQIANET